MSRHVLDQLPLWIEGDLDPTEQVAVDTHLDQCPDCREAAEQLRASQSWLRETMTSPFDASDQERLRRKVMDQVRAEIVPKPVRRLAVRPGLLVACAATLLIATFTWRHAQPMIPPPPSTQPTVVTPLPTFPQPLPAQAQTDPLRMARAHTPPHARREAPSLPQEEPARIEIQTSNPNIRIIWLAQAKPLPEPTAFLPEAP